MIYFKFLIVINFENVLYLVIIAKPIEFKTAKFLGTLSIYLNLLFLLDFKFKCST